MTHPELMMATSFQPAVWLEKLLSELFSYSVHGVLCNNRFIALNKNPLLLSDGVCAHEVNEADYCVAPDPLFLKNNIIFGALPTQKKEQQLSPSYSLIRQCFIRFEVAELNNALSNIVHHLKNRKSAQRMISEHSVIQDLLSQIIVRINTLKMLIDNFSQAEACAEEVINDAKKLIIAVCLDLGKLQGGQAFLFGGMSEMLWFFQNIHAVYLS